MTIIKSIIVIIFVFASHFAFAESDVTSPDFYKKERALYQLAMQHLEKGNYAQFEESRSKLQHYPLISYLNYEYLRRNFPNVTTNNIRDYLNEYQGYLPAKRLHIEWLGYLAKTYQWRIYEDFYQPELASEVLDCYHLQAKLAMTSDDKPVYEEIGEFWIKPNLIHSACDDIFKQWSAKGYKSQEKIWRRYQLALRSNNRSLQASLEGSLNSANKNTAKLIKSVSGNMDFWKNRLSNKHEDLHLESATIKFILNTMTNNDYKKAAYVFEKKKVAMKKADEMEVQRLVAWYIAKHETGAAAVKWMRKYTDFRDQSFVDPMLRYALQEKNWKLYTKVFTGLPAIYKNQEEWLYWYAIAQEELKITDNDPILTRDFILQKLAQEQSFYGLLAAKKLNLPIFPNTQFKPQPQNFDSKVLAKIGGSIELFHMGKTAESNTDWYYITSHFNEDEWRQAGIIAYKMGWINRTIMAFGKAKLWTAAEERFPILYREDFWKNAQRQDIDPGWVLAVARQESAFSPVARSHVGALGLLQLMPATAKRVAQSLGMSYSDKKLLDPSYNITLGTKYLKNQINRYNGNYILATAAYNAGPGKVSEWLAARPLTEDWAHWVALIPYKETRGYVQNITVFSKVYDMKLAYIAGGKMQENEDQNSYSGVAQ